MTQGLTVLYLLGMVLFLGWRRFHIEAKRSLDNIRMKRHLEQYIESEGSRK